MTPREQREFDDLKRQHDETRRELTRISDILDKERGGSKEGPSTRTDSRGAPLVGGSSAGGLALASGIRGESFQPLRRIIGDSFPNADAISMVHSVVTPPGDLPGDGGTGLPTGYGPEEFTICDSGTPVTRKFITDNPD